MVTLYYAKVSRRNDWYAPELMVSLVGIFSFQAAVLKTDKEVSKLDGREVGVMLRRGR